MTKRRRNISVAHDTTGQGAEFLSTMRGRYIIAQALYYGIKALESVTPDVMQEKSNIEDMKFFQETLFTIPTFVFEPINTVVVEPIDTVAYPV